MQVDRLVNYWMSKQLYESRPCISGTGDNTGLIYNIISWVFLTAKTIQVDKIERRDRYFVTKDAPPFGRLITLRLPDLPGIRNS